MRKVRTGCRVGRSARKLFDSPSQFVQRISRIGLRQRFLRRAGHPPAKDFLWVGRLVELISCLRDVTLESVKLAGELIGLINDFLGSA